MAPAMDFRAEAGVSGRQIADKTYYVGLLNTQLAALDTEIASLENELGKAEKEQRNLLVYEQKAEEQAKEIKELQGELADYNLLIDRQTTNIDLSELEYDYAEQQQHHAELAKAVEELFQERKGKEDLAHSLELQINEVKRRNENLINDLPEETKEEFEHLKNDMEEWRQRVEDAQSQVQRLSKQKDEMDLALDKSPLKLQAMTQQEQIDALAEKKALLEREMTADASPEQQKNQLIEQIKRHNEEISRMQEQIEELNVQVQITQEELREFDNEYEIMAGEKNERYRELKLKERQLDDFLSSFESSKVELGTQLAQRQSKAVNLLRLISANCQQDELAATVTGMDESAIASAMNSSINPAELQDLHVRLQEEIITLDETEENLKAKLDSLHKHQEHIKNSEQELSNFESTRSRLEEAIKKLDTERNDLRAKVSAGEKTYSSLQNQLITLVSGKVDKNVQLKELRRRHNVSEEERERLRSELRDRQAEFDYRKLKEEGLRLCAEHNRVLQADRR